ncbi:alpha/beta fold hydrolase [Deinococcus sp. KSM4-11]|uniref:alpha/beta hydrolase n=1 Tax=Deinococcus sp. KSM4-11 TaxID=2568654 RepID=UPI0010A2CF62|nr:alpha/beta hydrolase [Deinococcus sp. KSM4-11]THF86605.1 alpha/beta fold hydrolase [Deinococcus sp. KSM4-11]
MRAREPDQSGHVERDGVRLHYEVFGSGPLTVFLLPTWSIIHSRFWKAQVHFLARHYRVLTYDGRGNGQSDRPAEPQAYRVQEFVADALAVMDATGTERAVMVGLSMGALRALHLAADHPERVLAAVFIGAAVNLAPDLPQRQHYPFDTPLDTTEGWAKFNAHAWRQDFRGFLEFFFGQACTEPHSTKVIEDCVGWGLDGDPDTLIASWLGGGGPQPELLELCARVRCPTLVLHGSQDAIRPHANGVELARATGGQLVTLDGSGHLPQSRDPVRVNLLLHEFLRPAASFPPVWTRAASRPRRALFVSSPIGLGHAQRDAAIARELRRLVPDLEIDWLAQDPVTRVLNAEGERVHPASAALASESRHIELEAAAHDLHVFQALRRMDEIFVANFMVFHEVVREQPYDLWIGDEAWEVDHFLHENPELKTAPYVWLSDFVGYLPMPDGGQPEAALTADYNAEMIEHLARHPRVRDRSLFVGQPDDIVPERFGPGLPMIRDWTEAHFAFPGYVAGFDPAALPARDELRAAFGFAPGEPVCVVTVGGSGVGEALLRRVVAAFDEARRLVPGLRMVVVAGPRIDPATLPIRDGLEVLAYVHNLYRLLAACDLAVVQGGLTTTMELVACGRPFLYFPLGHHFEQQFHVPHRLNRYGAGHRMDFTTATPSVIAGAIASTIGRPATSRPVETTGAARAAAMIAELL